MDRRNVLCIALVAASCTLFVAAYSSSPAAEERPVDTPKFQRAPVVLRARLISAGEGSDKYLWPEVEILAILKNDSPFKFGKRLSVAHYSTRPGIPAGVSTLYLERYNPGRDDHWKLLDGSGAVGVSHTKKDD